MKRKVFLIRNVSPEKYGGGETYQLILARLLKKERIEPVIITSSNKLLLNARKENIRTIKAPFIRNQNWSGWRNVLLPVYFLWQIRLYFWYRKIFKRFNPDVVNIQSRDDWIAGTLAGKKIGIRVLWTDHMDFRSWVLINVEKKYKNFIGKIILKCAQYVYKIIMISDYERKNFDEITSGLNLKNVTTIKNGAIDKYIDYKKIKSKDESFCYVGRVVDYKGINELIKSFNIISNEYPKAVLNIYGDGPDRKSFEKLAKKNEKIIFHGETDKPLEAISSNEIFILPSYREGLSLSLLDAVMLGRVIIASNVDGNPEVVGDGAGLMVPVKNINALKDAMLKVLNNKELRKSLSENARVRYLKDFDLERVFKEKMLPLYSIEEIKK